MLSCTQMWYFNGGALYEIPYNSAYNALLHVTNFFFELQIYKKISPKLCLVKLFISLPKTLRKNQ